jgi:hypothetical protein
MIRRTTERPAAIATVASSGKEDFWKQALMIQQNILKRHSRVYLKGKELQEEQDVLAKMKAL